MNEHDDEAAEDKRIRVSIGSPLTNKQYLSLGAHITLTVTHFFGTLYS